MRTHVNRTVSRCFDALRQLRQVRRLVPTTTLYDFSSRSRLDYRYGKGVLVGIPAYLMLRRLQSALTAAARHNPFEIDRPYH